MSSVKLPLLTIVPLVFALCSGPACGAQDSDSSDGTAAAQSVPENRVLVIGWDGATFEMIDPLLEADRLPNLAKLLARGRSARLESTRIPISPAAWTSMSTGRDPATTGIYSFFESVPGSKEVQLISSERVMQPPLWRLLSAQGKRSHVVGVPVTWPPEEIQGSIVSGMLSPLDGAWATPSPLHATLKKKGLVPDLGNWREEQDLNMERLSHQLQLKEQSLIEQLEDDWTLAWVVFKNLDVMSRREYDGKFDGAVAKVYEQLDATLGRLVAHVEGADREEGEAPPPPTDIVLVSGYGFRSYKKTFNLQTWMLHEGFSVINGPISAQEPEPGPLNEAGVVLNRKRLDQLSFDLTRAVAGPCQGNFGSVRVMLEGRDVDGEVPLGDFNYLLDDIAERLREMVTPDYLDPMLKNVWHMDELYSGDFRERLPDLVFEIDEQYLVRNALDLKMHTRFETEPIASACLEGVFFAAGPSFAPSKERGDLTLLDIAPTILHILDVPAHEEMSGSTLTPLLTGVAAKREPVRVRALDDPAYLKARKATYPAASGAPEPEKDRSQEK